MILIQWVLITASISASLGMYGILLSGLFVRMIRWADAGILTCICVWMLCDLALMMVEGAYPYPGALPWPPWGILGVGEGIAVAVILTPLSLAVAAARRRRGWTVSIAGRPGRGD